MSEKTDAMLAEIAFYGEIRPRSSNGPAEKELDGIVLFGMPVDATLPDGKVSAETGLYQLISLRSIERQWAVQRKIDEVLGWELLLATFPARLLFNLREICKEAKKPDLIETLVTEIQKVIDSTPEF